MRFAYSHKTLSVASELETWKDWEAKRRSWSVGSKFLHTGTVDTRHASAWLALHRRTDQSEREQRTKEAMAIAQSYSGRVAVFRTQGTGGLFGTPLGTISYLPSICQLPILIPHSPNTLALLGEEPARPGPASALHRT